MKEEIISEYLKKPLQVGDRVYAKISNYSKRESFCKITSISPLKVKDLTGRGEVLEISEDKIVSKYTRHIGHNPFDATNDNLRSINYTLESILHLIGFEKRVRIFRTEKFGDIEINELNWNPYVTKNGEKKYYQRDFIWTLKEKQLLLESIFNGINCGKIILKKYSYEYVQKQLELGNTEVAFRDVVDGKQRLNAILDFVLGKYQTQEGYFFDDLSEEAQIKFFDNQLISYSELSENANDDEVLQTFLKVNFTGIPQSQEHIDYVKTLYKNK